MSADDQTASVNQKVAEMRERCETNTENEARMEVCVTRVEEVDDVSLEKTEEQRKQEELGERKTTRQHDPRQPSEQERIEHGMTHLPFRSWCRRCIKGRGQRRTVAKQLKKRERDCGESQNSILNYMFMGDEKEEKRWRFWWPQHNGSEEVRVAKERATRGCAQHGGLWCLCDLKAPPLPRHTPTPLSQKKKSVRGPRR